MEFSLQKIQTAKKIVNLISDMQFNYQELYGNELKQLDKGLQQLFLVNCDVEIQNLLEKENIFIHENTYAFGITYGILIIEHEIKYHYDKYYKNIKSFHIKERMYNEIYNEILNYLICGIKVFS